MRILHVDHSPVYGGAERSILELARSQRASGTDARVAVGRTGPFGNALADARVPAMNMGWPGRFVSAPADAGPIGLAIGAVGGIVAVARLRRVIRTFRPDVLQAHTRKAQLVATAACIRSGVPVVWHLRDDVPRRRILRSALRLAVRRADHAVALSAWLSDHYRRSDMLPRSGVIDIVPSGVDPTEFQGMSTPWLDGAREPVIGYVGRLADWKAPHLLIDAAERLSDMPAVRFAIIGGIWFPAAEGPYARWLVERLTESPARGRITMPGTLSPVEAFNAIDVLVHTSVQPEPFGRVIVEAMVARRPVVAFRHGGASEILDDTTGTLAEFDGR